MGTYDAYPRQRNVDAITPPMTFEATNDFVAIARAIQLADGCDLEIWLAGQRVGIVEYRTSDGAAGANLFR